MTPHGRHRRAAPAAPSALGARGVRSGLAAAIALVVVLVGGLSAAPTASAATRLTAVQWGVATTGSAGVRLSGRVVEGRSGTSVRLERWVRSRWLVATSRPAGTRRTFSFSWRAGSVTRATLRLAVRRGGRTVWTGPSRTLPLEAVERRGVDPELGFDPAALPRLVTVARAPGRPGAPGGAACEAEPEAPRYETMPMTATRGYLGRIEWQCSRGLDQMSLIEYSTSGASVGAVARIFGLYGPTGSVIPRAPGLPNATACRQIGLDAGDQQVICLVAIGRYVALSRAFQESSLAQAGIGSTLVPWLRASARP